MGFGQADTDGAERHVHAIAQRHQRSNRRRRIVVLHRCTQARMRQSQTGARADPVPGVFVDVDAVFAAQSQGMGPDAFGLGQQSRRRVGFRDHRGAPGAEDPGLLDGNRFARVAEVLLVVEIDGGDDGDIGIQQIHRVEAPAQADFEDRDIERGVVKQAHRGQGRELEARCRHARHRWHGIADASSPHAVNDDALVETEQMRRGVAPTR
jgi:hypothetical protein